MSAVVLTVSWSSQSKLGRAVGGDGAQDDLGPQAGAGDLGAYDGQQAAFLDVPDQGQELAGLELAQHADPLSVDLDLDGLVGGAWADLVDRDQGGGDVVDGPGAAYHVAGQDVHVLVLLGDLDGLAPGEQGVGRLGQAVGGQDGVGLGQPR